MSAELHKEYVARIGRLVDALGSMRAVARQLGLEGNASIGYRLKHPASVRREHLLAAEMLEARITRHGGPKA